MNIEDFIAQHKDKIEIIGGEENEIEIEETTHYELDNVVCFEDKEKFSGKLILTNLYCSLFFSLNTAAKLSRNVKFVCENDEVKAWKYQEIIMHSISKDTSVCDIMVNSSLILFYFNQ